MAIELLPEANLDGFGSFDFSHGEQTKKVYFGGSGPGIVLMHEVPCLHRNIIDLGRSLIDAGFSVWMPVLFGRPGAAVTPLSIASSMAKICISREFKVLASRETSPVTEWLRALVRHVHAECNGPGIGVLGMCLTGGFGLAMMADPVVIAPVLANPSLPFAVTSERKCAYGIDERLLCVVKERSEKNNIPILALRFTADPAVPGERFEQMRQDFGERLIAVEIDSSPANSYAISRWAHSVLGVSYVDEVRHPTRLAREKVLEFFKTKLLLASTPYSGGPINTRT